MSVECVVLFSEHARRGKPCLLTMSIRGLCSSTLITAVLRALHTSCRPSERPDIMVLTFQVPSFSAGVFCFFCFFVFQVQCVSLCLSGQHPKPHAPSELRQTNRGGIAPYWPGLPSLRRVVAVQWEKKSEDLSQHWKQPLALRQSSTEAYNR